MTGRLVLQCFRGSQLRLLVVGDSNGLRIVPVPGGAVDWGSIDRLLLFDKGRPLVLFSIVSGIAPFTVTPTGTLTLRFAVRHFLAVARNTPQHRGSAISFTIVLRATGADGNPSVIESTTIAGQEIPPDNGPAHGYPASLLAGIACKLAPERVDQPSGVVAKLGLALDANGDQSGSVSFQWDDEALRGHHDPNSEATGRLLLRIDSVLPVRPDAQQLTPFGLPYASLALGTVAILQRQPLCGALGWGDILLPDPNDPTDPKKWRLHPLEDGPGHWLLHLNWELPQLRKTWNENIVASHWNALRAVRDGRPLSLLPEFEVLGGPNDFPWRVKLSVLDSDRVGTITADLVQVAAPTASFAPGKIVLMPRTIEPMRELAGRIRCPGFSTTLPGRPLTLSCVVRPPRPDPYDERDLQGDKRGFYFALRRLGDDGTGQTVRLGALELAMAPAPAPGSVDIEARDAAVEVGCRMTRASSGDDVAGVVELRQLSLYLPVAAVRPGGQDDVPGTEFVDPFESADTSRDGVEYERNFRRRPPLVLIMPSALPAKSSPPTAMMAFYVGADEKAFTAHSQTLRLALIKLASSPDSRVDDVLIIDADPFLVARVRVDDFERDLVDAVTNEIAHFSTAGDPAWQMSAGARGFFCELPPQAVGEAMEKVKDDPREPNTGKRAVGDIAPGEAADFRFGPTARFQLRPSYFEQRFAEPPWNLRRILGWAGERAPGATIDQMDFELLYGLTAHVRRSGLRLTEIAARLGNVPGRQRSTLPWLPTKDQKDQYDLYRKGWAKVFREIRERLSVLEPWDGTREDASFELRGTPTDTGLTFQLREAKLRFPALGGRPEDAPKVPDSAKLPDGLAGGVAWGFESVNIYNALWREPVAVDGELRRLYFSALGGWGFQKAAFDKGLTTIYSDTAMGRTSFISIERLGRIGVFWNRAKHVIVYERSVAPSRQFYNEVNKDEQDAHRGRPIVRKVREYVEILQPQREIPAGSARGFVRGIEFPETSRIINVNSRWGADVRQRDGGGTTVVEGWKVPLWLRAAAPADVYPKPQAFTVVDGEDAANPERLAIDEPEKLYFWTSTLATDGGDPDLWGAAPGVDYDVFDDDEVKPAPNPGFGDGDLETAGAEEPAVHPGLGHFTLALVPSARPANLVANRVEQAMGALLRNVTVMRGRPTGPVPAPRPGAAEIARLGDQAANAFEKARAVLTDAATPDVVAKTLDALATAKGEVAKTVDDIGKALSSSGGFEATLCSELKARVDAQLRAVEDTIREALQGVRGRLLAELRTLPNDVQAWKQQANLAIDRVFDAAAAAWIDVGAVGTHPLHAVRGTLADLQRRVDGVPKQVDACATQVNNEIDALVDAVDTLDPADIHKQIVARRAKIDDLVRQITWSIAEALRDLLGDRADALRPLLRDAELGVENKLREAELRVRRWDDTTKAKVIELLRGPKPAPPTPNSVAGQVAAMSRQVGQVVADKAAGWSVKLAGLSASAATAEQAGAGVHSFIRAQQAKTKAVVAAALANASVNVEDVIHQVDAALGVTLDPKVSDAVKNAARSSRTIVTDQIDSVCSMVFAPVQAVVDDVKTTLARFDVLANLVQSKVLQSGEEALRELAGLQQRAAATLDEYARRAATTIVKSIPLSNNVEVELVRAFGAPPRVPNLDFRLPGKLETPPGIAYVFPRATDLKVLTSPLIGLPAMLRLPTAPDGLSAMRLAVPSDRLLRGLLPVALDTFTIDKVFKNFAGLDFAGLFPAIKLPSTATDNVRITHGIEAQSRQAWLQADVDVDLPPDTTIFAIAGVTVRLQKGGFHAQARFVAEAGASPRQTTAARIVGNLDLQVGGFDLAVIEDAAINFGEGGRLTVKISPDKVKLQSVLSFLADLLSSFGYSDRGFSVRLLPTGVQAVLDLPLPDVQAGAFGIANLHLGFLFELSIAPDFTLAAHLFVGSRTSPFTLTVFILGGAGWLDFAVAYTPATKTISTAVSIGITAAASIAFAAGPIRGGVYAYFGITVEYRASSGGYNSLNVGLLLLFRGEVCLLSLFQVGICLSLETQYSQGGTLVGRGRVSYTIKICWCVTINVSAAVEYSFGKPNGAGAHAAPSGGDVYKKAANDYVDMFAR
jgi:hypothetical protein